MKLGSFAENIASAKYYMKEKGESKWADVANRVVPTVLSAAPKPVLDSDIQTLADAMSARKFMPGGRYCYATGRPYHQTQNCVLLRAHDSREGWADLLRKGAMALMTGAGVGVDYGGVREEGSIIRKTGGFATGPIALMQMFNESGRGIMQGGARRAAIWARLPWSHPDIHKFIGAKNWSDDVRAMKEKDFSFPAFLDHTNISAGLDDLFFVAYEDRTHPLHSLAQSVYWAVIPQMLKTAEPGFSIDVGENAGETLRNACVSGGTYVLTYDGYIPINLLVGLDVKVWNGSEWSYVRPKITAHNQQMYRVTLEDGRTLDCTGYHRFVMQNRSVKPTIDLKAGDKLIPSNCPVRFSNIVKDNVDEPTIASVEKRGIAKNVYCFNEPIRHQGCFNGIVTGQCTEVTSRDTDDICNLASINMGSVDTIEEFAELVRLGTTFLLAGTLYSDVPYHEIDVVRTKNRRLGLGLMGIHEWLLKRGKKYGVDSELAEWLSVYRDVSRSTADNVASDWAISCPKKVRAIAPTGTIGIVAETTTGIEPIFCVAYKRRYLKDGSVWVHEYVVDPVARRLISQGVDPDSIEDAYSLARDVERRVQFQAFVQEFVDHGISSTINLPHWGSRYNNQSHIRPFGEMLYKYLPKLRGVTVYPDGARGGQPLTPVKYSTALKHEGQIREETANICDIRGGSCND